MKSEIEDSRHESPFTAIPTTSPTHSAFALQSTPKNPVYTLTNPSSPAEAQGRSIIALTRAEWEAERRVRLDVRA